MRWYSFPLFLCFTTLASCGIDPDANSELPACNGPDCQGTDAGTGDALADDDFPAPPVSADDESVDSGATEPQPDAGATERFPVCSGLCSPDDSASCVDFDPDDPLDERSLYQNGSSSLLMLRQLMEQTDAGAPDASAGSLDGSSEAGSASSPPDGTWSCQIDRDEGEVAVGCYLSGVGEDAAPCTSSRDCRGGYACVGEQGVGLCRKFCCGGDSACVTLDAGQDERDHFCDERPLRSINTAGTEALMVPVCAQADMCDLSEPFPCEDSASCTCKDGKACTVVNAAGATGCRVPGEGGLDEACPCLPGFLCDPIENTCKQLCNLELPGCGDSICQATANFPAGWGVCQSVAPETD